MVYLVSTTHHLLALDTRIRKVFIVHSGRGLYYGLGFSNDRIWVGCRNSIRSPGSELAREHERGSILSLGSETLECRDVLEAPFPLRDIHGLCCSDDHLFVTCSFDN